MLKQNHFDQKPLFFRITPLSVGKHPRHKCQHNSLVPCSRILRQIWVQWHPHVVRWRPDCREISPGNYLQFSLLPAIERGWDPPLWCNSIIDPLPPFVSVGGLPDPIEQQMNTLFPLYNSIQPCNLNGTALRHKSYFFRWVVFHNTSTELWAQRELPKGQPWKWQEQSGQPSRNLSTTTRTRNCSPNPSLQHESPSTTLLVTSEFLLFSFSLFTEMCYFYFQLDTN